ncbi:MAG: LPXTG cell wall anchor domain-containing protein [Atopobiaceae bacterium]|nr:LPXTG cell wall anchor domain-containing protein [Atopobiaceae bacterium]MCI1497929.1 LPXTG cell wall anchor domain-containing protein [Atopobiaceae bacterium]MCI1539660.1 LPXTG cell wall anchor domain-containing protein [Atopobiaceae bacterium]
MGLASNTFCPITRKSVGTFLQYTHIGQDHDATSLDNLADAIKLIKASNLYRANDTYYKGEKPGTLKVSTLLMALTEINANWNGRDSNQTSGHAVNTGEQNGLGAYGENQSMHGSVGSYPRWRNFDYDASDGDDYGTNAGKTDWDTPFDGWYLEERYNYITNNGQTTGHYTGLMGWGNTGVTGFALSEYKGSGWYYQNAMQEFSYSNETVTGPDGEAYRDALGIYDVDEFENLYNLYVKALSQKTASDKAAAAQTAFDAAQKTKTEKQAAYDIAAKKLTDAQTAVKDAQSKADKAQAAYDAATSGQEVLMKQLQDAQTDLAAKQNALKTAKQNQTDAATKLADAGVAKKTADEAKKAADEALAAAKTDAAAKKAAADTADRAAADAVAKADVAKKAADAAEAVYEKALAGKETAQKDLDEANKALKDALDAYAQAQDALSQAKDELGQKKSAADASAAKAEDAAKTLADANAAKDKADSDYAALAAQKAAADAAQQKAEDLKKEAADLAAKTEELSAKQADLEKQAEQYRQVADILSKIPEPASYLKDPSLLAAVKDELENYNSTMGLTDATKAAIADYDQRLADAIALAEEANKLDGTIAEDQQTVSDTDAKLAQAKDALDEANRSAAIDDAIDYEMNAGTGAGTVKQTAVSATAYAPKHMAESALPNTGDTQNPALPLGLAGAGLLAAFAGLRRRREK